MTSQFKNLISALLSLVTFFAFVAPSAFAQSSMGICYHDAEEQPVVPDSIFGVGDELILEITPLERGYMAAYKIDSGGNILELAPIDDQGRIVSRRFQSDETFSLGSIEDPIVVTETAAWNEKIVLLHSEFPMNELQRMAALLAAIEENETPCVSGASCSSAIVHNGLIRTVEKPGWQTRGNCTAFGTSRDQGAILIGLLEIRTTR